jgi:hypothetical protein
MLIAPFIIRRARRMRRNRKFVLKVATGTKWNINKSDFNCFLLRVDAESSIIEEQNIQLGFMDESETVFTGKVILVC